MVDQNRENPQIVEQKETSKDRSLREYIARILVFGSLLFLLSQSGVEASKKPVGDHLNNNQFAAALMTLHSRSEYHRSDQFAIEEMRASGSFVEIGGKLWFLSVEHAANEAKRLKTEVHNAASGSSLTPDHAKSWVTAFLGKSSNQLELSFDSAPALVKDQDPAVLTQVSENVGKELQAMGITPFTRVESLTRETMDPNKYYYLITTFSSDIQGSNPQVWIAQLHPSTEAAYRKKYAEDMPWATKNPRFATTEFIGSGFLPFTVTQVLQPIQNLTGKNQDLDTNRFSKVATCQAMSGSAVVMSSVPIDQVASTDDLTVVGVLSGPSFLTGPILPVIDPNGESMQCSTLDDFLNVAPISAIPDQK